MDRYLVYSDAEDLIALSANFMVVQTLQTFVVLNIFWPEPLFLELTMGELELWILDRIIWFFGS
jgi:hypothetical protein